MDLVDIQHAIEELPKEQQATLAAWIMERDQAEWDAEIERDFAPRTRGPASSGRLGKAGRRSAERQFLPKMAFRSFASERFWQLYSELPIEVQRLADKAIRNLSRRSLSPIATP